jgi:hypothetical protein
VNLDDSYLGAPLVGVLVECQQLQLVRLDELDQA